MDSESAIVHSMHCKKSLESGGVEGTVMMNLSKAFDCLNHELLIAKLDVYGFCRSALFFIHSYIYYMKQRAKVDGSFSTWAKTILGILQDSALGLFLFNIYLNDLFMFWRKPKSATVQMIQPFLYMVLRSKPYLII